MSIPIVCTNCGKTGAVPDDMAGRKVRCPQCRTAIQVDEPEIQSQPRGTRRGLAIPILLILLAGSLGLNLVLVIIAGWMLWGRPTEQPEVIKAEAQAPIARDAPLEKQPAPPPLPDWSKIGDTARSGSVEIKIVRVGGSGAYTRTGARQDVGIYTTIALVLTNTHESKNVRFGGWSNSQSKIQDEDGNSYQIKPFRKGLKLYEDFGTWVELNPAESAILYPKQPHNCSLYCETIGGNEARLGLPGQAINETGLIFLRKEKTR